ncbi:MAG TPA: STAS domain-containing protein [Anaerolineae bacterium]|nr:STAS domain-containing protein [Anaerolineae bacterium]
MNEVDLDFNVVKVEKFQNIAIVTMKERMDSLNAPLLMQEFNQLVEDGIQHFIVDLSNVRDGIDGDYPLLHLLKCTYEVGGSVTLICPAGNYVRVYYEATHYDTLFEMVESREKALRRFNLNFSAALAPTM